LGKINDAQPFVWGCKLLYVVVCPGINNVVVVVVTFGIVNSVPSCVERLFIGLLVNGSRSYNLNQRIYLQKKLNFRVYLGRPRVFFDEMELILEKKAIRKKRLDLILLARSSMSMISFTCYLGK